MTEVLRIRCGMCGEGEKFALYVDDVSMIARCLVCDADARVKDLEWTLSVHLPESRRKVRELKVAKALKKGIDGNRSGSK